MKKAGTDLKDCSRCAVYTPKGEKLLEARVVHSGQEVTIYFPSYSLSDKRLKTRVDFYDERQGLVMTLSEVLVRRNPDYPEMPEPWLADVTILETKRVVQRQKDIRVKVDIETTFERAEGLGVFRGTIQNISAGGVYVATRQPLQRGEHIFFSYIFRTLERPFELEVIRIERPESGGYGYGCRFIGLTDGADSAIRGFAYKKQQEKRAEEK